MDEETGSQTEAQQEEQEHPMVGHTKQTIFLIRALREDCKRYQQGEISADEMNASIRAFQDLIPDLMKEVVSTPSSNGSD